ncbi:hypothetical protein NC652_020123 [Populus alba x Populus x berolinensis]|uniref:Uncharacterized protein n=1 Tax=Populus alba x Populus x berolinensis TaxID=444605 RepID=A0AAD6MJ49_9ROSI|nr:hypothetical protein NC651_019363 [Populus alba x Populus x berolinensis]KAJ6909062.1 hypothetical protein NC652_020123 [Populus alba x Populus x berolinensis]KAJ6986561.1 hypothetical protein NC653_019930 [Populus alba x Populus x berolinensis]
MLRLSPFQPHLHDILALLSNKSKKGKILNKYTKCWRTCV